MYAVEKDESSDTPEFQKELDKDNEELFGKTYKKARKFGLKVPLTA